MFNPELMLDANGVLSDEQWIMKNGISGNLPIHDLLRNMINELDLQETNTDKIFVCMQKRLINILVCVEAANRLNISDEDMESIVECMGKMALSVGFDMMRYNAETNNSALKILRREFAEKYLHTMQD